MKKILIFQAHPLKDSFCSALADAYARGAKEKGIEIKRYDLSDLTFDPDLHHAYRQMPELEPDIKKIQEEIKSADHLVFVFPTWWGSFPARLKGLTDRVFIPGFAFRYRKNSPLPETLLKGKSARLIVTMDALPIYYRLFLGKPGVTLMKKSVLEFCGVKPVRVSLMGSVKNSTLKKREKWLDEIRRSGAKCK